MALHKSLLIAAASMAVVVGALLPVITAVSNNHVVGDDDGWDLGVNYDNWARANDGIPVGDTLKFVYDPVFHDVVQVWDEDSYNRCIVPSNARTWSSGDDVLQLVDAGMYFFFCSNDCTRGMKFAITAI